MIHSLARLLIVAATAAAPQEARQPDAVEIFHCTFDESWDQNFDQWPDRWTRQRGPMFPDYLAVGIAEDASAVHGRALRIELDGGSAALFSPAMPVDARFSYVVNGRLKTSDLTHDRAWLSITFYDRRREPLETITTAKIDHAEQWSELTTGPISPKSADAASAVIGLHLGPMDTAGRADLRGFAMIDDVWFARLPRMAIHTSSEYNVYSDPGDVMITCTLTGIREPDPEIEFELLDADGRWVDSETKRAEGMLIQASESDLASHPDDARPAGYTATTGWKPSLNKGGGADAYGFYRVRVRMRSPMGTMHNREVSLAVIRPFAGPERGEFGWSLPLGDRPLSLDALAGLLPQVGVNWLKFPVWYDVGQDARGEALMRFAERLGTKDIELVGVLAEPPPEIAPSFGDDGPTTAANIFSSDPTLWIPSLDAVMTRLSLKIRWWQLGKDHDTSFVGYPRLAEKVTEIKNRLYRFGQEVHLGFAWPWLAEEPADATPPWHFLTRSADPPLTGDEMSTYLAAAGAKSAQRWVLVEPLSRRHYSMQTRAHDLVSQMMAAKIEQADGIFVPDPFHLDHGLMNDDGTPGEMLLPWRTTAMMLGGSQYLGSIRMPGGSQNHIFTRRGEAVMVVWNEQPTEEVIYLGDDVRQIDVWGRMTQPAARAHRQVIHAGPLPTFLTGISESVARWRMAVRLERDKVPSVFGVEHENAVIMTNTFGQGLGGTVLVNTPEVWTTYPRQMNVKLADGETLHKPFSVTLKFDASSGKQDVRLDFVVNADRTYRFSVYRDLSIGMGDVTIALSTKLDEHGALVVTQRMTNVQEQFVDFKCMLYAPKRRRQRNQVYRLGRGEDVKTYRLPAGQELIGQRLWLRAEEVGGQRILNYLFTAEE